MTAGLWRRIWRHVESGQETPKVDLKMTVQLSGTGEAEFVKDVTAIANTPGGEGYIVVGVRDAKDRQSCNPGDYITGFRAPGSPDQFERTAVQILNKFCDRAPTIQYTELVHPESGQTIGVFTIPRSSSKPHALVRAAPGIEQHQVWVRRGSASYPARPDEIIAMKASPSLPESVIVNLSAHPLTDEQRGQIEQSVYIEEEIDVPAHCSPDDASDYIPKLFEKIGLTSEEWSAKSIILALPGLAPLAASVLAYAHGLKGSFPKVLWITPDTADKTKFVVGDIVDLQAIRNNARQSRTQQMAQT